MVSNRCLWPTILSSACILTAFIISIPERPAYAQSRSPKETYLAYLRAVDDTKDFEDVRLFRTEKNRAAYRTLSPEGVQMMKDSLPKKVRILSEVVNGNTATLKADGTISMKSFAPQVNAMGAAVQRLSAAPVKPMPMIWHSTGTINFEKEDGEWRISEEKWQADDPNKPAPGTPAAIAADKAAAAAARAAVSADAWCTQAVTKAFPNKPATGKVMNVPFVTDDAYIYEFVFPTSKLTSLNLVKGPGNMPVDIDCIVAIPEPVASLAGKTIIIRPDTKFEPGKQQPYVQIDANLGQPMPGKVNAKSQIYTVEKHFGMRITFSQMRGDKLPGYIMLHLPDSEQSFVEGYFYATVRKGK